MCVCVCVREEGRVKEKTMDGCSASFGLFRFVSFRFVWVSAFFDIYIYIYIHGQ